MRVPKRHYSFRISNLVGILNWSAVSGRFLEKPNVDIPNVENPNADKLNGYKLNVFLPFPKPSDSPRWR
jgi:hypothetical protein